jgi:superfamily II DNA or RNA helicase
MTREDILQEVLELKGNNYLLELATGVGKSRLAIELIKKLSDNKGNLLIVVPRNVHKTNWQEEIIKWWSDCQLKLSYTTYVSLPKYAGNWDYVIFDECHHLSDRCREAIDSFNITHSVLCSATVNYNLKNTFELIFKDLVIYKKDLRDVIEDNILPDPKVYLCPIKLNNTIISESIWKNTKAKGKLINCSFAERSC